MPITVAIVEDSREIREGFSFLIGLSEGLVCGATCGSGEEALKLLPVIKPDVVLMDIHLPGISGIECLKKLKQILPGTQIMMLTIVEDHDLIFEALSSGATGYLLKKTPPAQIVEAIRELHRGGSPMTGEIARRVIQSLQKPPPPDGERLTPREEQILKLLAEGLLYKEIAEAAHLSIHTVRSHLRNIYEKLQVRTRSEAIRKTFTSRFQP